MENIRQSCPQCQSILELPAAAVGRMARCPSCQATFLVETPASSQPLDPVASQAYPADGGRLSEPLPSAAKPSGSNPYTGERPSSFDGGTNPYAMTPGMAAAGALPVDKGAIVVRTAGIDRIVSQTIAIFSARWQPLVLSGLVFFALAIVVGGISAGTGAVLGNAPGNFAALINYSVGFVCGLLTWYLTLGMMNVGLLTARGAEASPANLFVPINVYGNLIGLIVVLAAIASLPQLLPLVVDQNQAPETFMFGTLISISFTSLLMGLFLWTTWPTFYLGVDRQAFGISALGTGFRIGTANLLNGFLMGLINVVLSVAAALSCCIGSIVTQPLFLLLGAVAYLMMSSQPVSDPNATPYPTPNYYPK